MKSHVKDVNRFVKKCENLVKNSRYCEKIKSLSGACKPVAQPVLGDNHLGRSIL